MLTPVNVDTFDEDTGMNEYKTSIFIPFTINGDELILSILAYTNFAVDIARFLGNVTRLMVYRCIHTAAGVELNCHIFHQR